MFVLRYIFTISSLCDLESSRTSFHTVKLTGVRQFDIDRSTSHSTVLEPVITCKYTTGTSNLAKRLTNSQNFRTRPSHKTSVT